MDLAVRKNNEAREIEKKGEIKWLQGFNKGVGWGHKKRGACNSYS
jgi:hypothetical protein